MRKFHLLFYLTLLPIVSSAQDRIGYSYDAAGNRVKREIVMPVPKAMAKQQTFAADGQAFTDMLRDHTVKIYPNPTEGGPAGQHFRPDGYGQMLARGLHLPGSPGLDGECQDWPC